MKVSVKKTGANWANKLIAYNQFKRNYPAVVGSLAVDFYKESFRRKGFINTAYEGWKARKKEGKRKGRAILVDTGRLRRSIRVLRAVPGYVAVGTDVPYAKAHNEGEKITRQVTVRKHNRKSYARQVGKKRKIIAASTVNSHSRKMNLQLPRRQFIGASAFLNRRILIQTDYRLMRIFN